MDKKKNRGWSIDDLLKKEDIFAEAQAQAISGGRSLADPTSRSLHSALRLIRPIAMLRSG
jgi:hypothetical protein